MKPFSLRKVLAATAFVVVLNAQAHCDRLDGPVIEAARKSLIHADLNPVLIWVDEKGEPEVRAAFEHVLAVRKLSAEAKALADRFFFETVVRVHRAGEGAPYTGLKETAEPLPKAIVLADQAVDSGKLAPVIEQLASEAAHAAETRFANLKAKESFAKNDIAAGRAYVHAYVEFIHLVEGIHLATIASGHSAGHSDPTAHADSDKKEAPDGYSRHSH